MGLEWRLAWRNVWRNPRRTGLTIAATVFAVYLVVVFVAMAAGVHEKMIEDAVRVHSGHVMVAGEGYLETRTLEQYVVLDPAMKAVLDGDPDVRGWTPRVTSFALLSRTSTSQGAAILGIDPAREGSVTTLPDRIRRGRFLSPASDAEREIVLGERLARSLEADLGDELLVYGVAYSLETAYELFRVVGIMKLPEPALDRTLALISLDRAAEFFVYGDRVSEIAVLADGADFSAPLRERLAGRLANVDGAPPLEVATWDEVMPDLEQIIFLDDAGMFLMLVILVVVVAFGILNTILMAVLERTREFGVMLAVGLRPGAVFRMIYAESLVLAALGLVVGLVLAIPTVLYFQANPIPMTGEMGGMVELFGFEPLVTFKLKPLNPLGSAITILGVGALAALYPAFKASRAQPAEVLRTL